MNSRMKTTFFALGTVVLASSFVACGFTPNFGASDIEKSQCSVEGSQKGDSAKMLRMVEGVELSADQEAYLEESKAALKLEIAPLKQEIMGFRTSLRENMRSENPSKEQILAAFDEITPIRGEIFTHGVTFMRAFLAQLTPEQIELVNLNLEECKGAADTAKSNKQKKSKHGNKGLCRGEGSCDKDEQDREEHDQVNDGQERNMDFSIPQMIQLMQLRDDMQNDIAGTKAELETERLEMCALWIDGAPEQKAILEQFEEMAPLQRQLIERMIDFRLSMNDILTPEQREQMKERMEQNSCGGEQELTETSVETDTSTETEPR